MMLPRMLPVPLAILLRDVHATAHGRVVTVRNQIVPIIDALRTIMAEKAYMQRQPAAKFTKVYISFPTSGWECLLQRSALRDAERP
jgi:hypothetical protein